MHAPAFAKGVVAYWMGSSGSSAGNGPQKKHDIRRHNLLKHIRTWTSRRRQCAGKTQIYRRARPQQGDEQGTRHQAGRAAQIDGRLELLKTLTDLLRSRSSSGGAQSQVARFYGQRSQRTGIGLAIDDTNGSQDSWRATRSQGFLQAST